MDGKVLPGFTAQDSLVKSDKQYGLNAHAQLSGHSVSPAGFLDDFCDIFPDFEWCRRRPRFPFPYI
jgi:hypothetical protein